jgi:hypothetical protein
MTERLGPSAWNPIVTLFRSGAFSFAGHFHDSGATSYDVSCVFAVRDAAAGAAASAIAIV